MGKETGCFLLGALTGSAATALILTNYYWRKILIERDCKSALQGKDALEATVEPEPAGDEPSEQEEIYFEGPLNDTNNGYHRRKISHSRSINSNDGSVSSISRRSFTIDEEDDSTPSSSLALSQRKCYADNPDAGTNCKVVTQEEWAANDEVIRQAKEFEEQILSKLTGAEEMEMALRRTRAVNALAHKLTEAKDEKACFEVASHLIVPLFKIDGCAFLLLKDSETIIVKHVTVSKHKYATNLGLEGGTEGLEVPLNRSAAALCAKTLEQVYTSRTKDSPFPGQQITYRVGLNTQLTTPILINGDKFAGCIVCCLEREDGFTEIDRMLIKNVAHMLGASIYSIRLRLAAESSNKVSREMLHSMIPAKVIEKIECFWDESTMEYQNRRSSSFVASQCSSIDDSDRESMLDETEFDLNDNEGESNTRNTIRLQTERKKVRKQHLRQSINNKINLLNEMNRDGPSDHVGVVIDTSAMELTSTHRALYAETVSNVCIIFTDIVGFSQISLNMKPIKVMDMLQDIFSRFDALCDQFGIQKLETIGDAYICTSGMFDNESDKNLSNNATRALGMAKAMVREARRVYISKRNSMETLEIRVGIHCGDLTCGVLGERLPKFTVFGSSVNLAARMEQTCLRSRIRVTKDFFDLLPKTEEVEAKEVITVKNMGEVETYLLNPLVEQFLPSSSEGDTTSSLSLYD